MKFITSNLKTLSTILIVLIGLSSSLRKRTQTKGNFSATCKNTRLNGSTLISECLTMNGKSVETSVNLSKCVTNNNGNLQKGGAYDRSSQNCRLEGASVLRCEALTSNGATNKNAKIDLNTFIANINGVFQGCGVAKSRALNREETEEEANKKKNKKRNARKNGKGKHNKNKKRN